MKNRYANINMHSKNHVIQEKKKEKRKKVKTLHVAEEHHSKCAIAYL